MDSNQDYLPEFKDAPILDVYLHNVLMCAKNPNKATAEAFADTNPSKVAAVVFRNKKYIKQKVAEYLKEGDIDKLRVMAEIKNIATSNVADYGDFSNGTMKWEDWEKLTRAEKACIKEVKVTTDKFGDKNVHFVLYDKQRALGDLVKILEISHDVVEHKGHITHGPRLFDKD